MKKNRSIALVLGITSLMLFIPTNNKIVNTLNPTLVAQAASSYDSNWQIDTSQTWHYKMNNGSYVTDAWVHDKTNGDWYLIDASGNMLAGIVESNEGKFYMFDNVRGTGHYGRMLKNGSIYNGITITADTSASYEGALSGESLAALTAAGVPVVGNVSGTQHVESGVVTFAGTKNSASGGGIGMGIPSEDIVETSDDSNTTSDDDYEDNSGLSESDFYLKKYGWDSWDDIGGGCQELSGDEGLLHG